MPFGRQEKTEIKLMVKNKPKIEKTIRIIIPCGNQNKMILTFPLEKLKTIGYGNSPFEKPPFAREFLPSQRVKTGSIVSRGEEIGHHKALGVIEKLVAEEDMIIWKISEGIIDYGKIFYSYLPLSPSLKDFLKNLLKTQ